MNMIRFLETKGFRFVLCTTVFLAISASMFAGETLTLSNGKVSASGTPIGSNDVFSGAVGNWIVEPATIGTATGTSSVPDLGLSTIDWSKTANPGSLIIVFTDTGFTARPLLFAYSDSASFLGSKTISDTVSILTNGTAASGATVVLTPVKQSQNGTVMIKPGTTYSITLTEVISATKAAGTIVSSDVLVGAESPEPGLYAVTGAGLAGMLVLMVRRKRRQALNG